MRSWRHGSEKKMKQGIGKARSGERRLIERDGKRYKAKEETESE
jgi:hypothetical protein